MLVVTGGDIPLGAAVPLGRVPREGTALRALFDYLLANKGKVIRIAGHGHAIEQLEFFYGFDLRRTGNGDALVAGREVGDLYHDFVAGRAVRTKDR